MPQIANISGTIGNAGDAIVKVSAALARMTTIVLHLVLSLFQGVSFFSCRFVVPIRILTNPNAGHSGNYDVRSHATFLLFVTAARPDL